MFKSLIVAAVVSLTALTMSVVPANALTIFNNGASQNGVVALAAGGSYQPFLFGDIPDVGGSYSAGFQAVTNIQTLETSAINPVGGFVGAVLTMSTAINGGGSVLGILSGVQLDGAVSLSIPMLAGQVIWATLTWTDVAKNNSTLNFRIEASAVPVPLPILLLGTALLGLGVLGRRRKAAA